MTVCFFDLGDGGKKGGECTQINRKPGEGEEEDKVVREEGGATVGLINHASIVIDFLFRAVHQTLNYVFVHMRCPLKAQSHQLQWRCS